jgi:integral membrane protein (TIGR01906 family)
VSRTWVVLGWVVPVAVGLLLVTTNVRVAAGNLALWESLFERHKVSQRTAIAPEALRTVAQQVQDYLSSDTEPLAVSAEVAGVETDLFGPDEASHMHDVKVVFARTFRLQEAMAVLVLAAIAAVWRWRREALWPTLASWLRRAGVLSVVVIGTVGVVSLVAFDPLFTLFHQIGFPQGNWTFPSSAYLVRVFPFGFWQDITLLIGLATVAEAVVAFVAGRAITVLSEPS